MRREGVHHEGRKIERERGSSDKKKTWFSSRAYLKKIDSDQPSSGNGEPMIMQKKKLVVAGRRIK